MPNDATSPYATYLSHLEKGELAYQFSPAANRAVFFPRVLCPYHGQRQARMARQQGPRHGLLRPPSFIRPKARRSTSR